METLCALYTRAQYDLLPEGFPAQLVEGQLVREASAVFGHQRIALAIASRLRDLVGARRLGIAPVDVPIDEWNVYQPDVVVWRQPLEDDTPYDEAGAPLLVVEVLSPSSATRDRRVKRVRLLDAGVEEVWLVEREERTIEVYDRGRDRDIPRRTTGTAALASQVLGGFALVPEDLFRR